HNHHGRSRLHLLLVVEVFSIRLFRWRSLLASAPAERTITSVAAIRATIHAFSPIMPLRAVASLLRRHSHWRMVAMILRPRQGRPDQLPVGEIILVGFNN